MILNFGFIFVSIDSIYVILHSSISQLFQSFNLILYLIIIPHRMQSCTWFWLIKSFSKGRVLLEIGIKWPGYITSWKLKRRFIGSWLSFWLLTIAWSKIRVCVCCPEVTLIINSIGWQHLKTFAKWFVYSWSTIWLFCVCVSQCSRIIGNILNYIKIFILPNLFSIRALDFCFILGRIGSVGARRGWLVECKIDWWLNFLWLVQKLLVAWSSNHCIDYRIR